MCWNDYMNRMVPVALFLLGHLFLSGCGRDPQPVAKPVAKSLKSKNVAEKKKSAFKVELSNLGSKGAPKRNFVNRLSFLEVPPEMGLDFSYVNGAAGNSLMVETTGGGSGWLDYDRDGQMDAYLCQGGDPTRGPEPDQLNDSLFRQLDKGRFIPLIESVGIVEHGYSQGVSVGDFDGDGFDDVYVTNVGKNSLWKNMGDGSFLEVTNTALVGDGERWSSTAAWADIDLDGDLDLYVCNYTQYDRFHPHPCLDKFGKPAICHPKHVDAWPDACYFNNGDGTFDEQSQSRSLFGKGNKGLGVAVADFNRDGYPDIYIANDTTANFLFKNDGNGQFEEVAGSLGCSVDRAGSFQASMGLGIFDYNQDGFLDIYSTHYAEESNTLYRNLGEKGFQDSTAIVDLHTPTVPWLGFGTIMADFDCDSRADIFIAQGHVNNTKAYLGKQKMPAGLFAFDGDYFHEVTQGGGDYFGKKFIGRGVSACDFDLDGDLDLLVSHQNDKASLLRNESQKGHWLKLKFTGIRSNRNGIGVQVTVTAGPNTYFQEVVGGTSYVSSNEPVLIFGLGDYSEACKIEVRWPTGEKQVLTSVSVDQQLQVIEGSNS